MTPAELPRGEKLFRFLAGLMLQRFYGTVTIRFESGKVTHVEAVSGRVWAYRDLPDGKVDPTQSTGNGHDSEPAHGACQ